MRTPPIQGHLSFDMETFHLSLPVYNMTLFLKNACLHFSQRCPHKHRQIPLFPSKYFIFIWVFTKSPKFTPLFLKCAAPLSQKLGSAYDKSVSTVTALACCRLAAAARRGVLHLGVRGARPHGLRGVSGGEVLVQRSYLRSYVCSSLVIRA